MFFSYGILYDKIIWQQLRNLWDGIFVCLCGLPSLHLYKQCFCFHYFHRVFRLSRDTISDFTNRQNVNYWWWDSIRVKRGEIILTEIITLENLRYSKKPNKNTFYTNAPWSRWSARMLHLSWGVPRRCRYNIARLL